MPMRGSFSSRISSARSRWIWSATRMLRLGIDDFLWRMVVFESAAGPQSTNPAESCGGVCLVRANSALQRSGDFLDLEELQLVALVDVVVVLDAEAALEAFLDLAHVVLEALEAVELPGEHHHVVAQQAHTRPPAHRARGDHAAGNRADLADAEHLAD